MSFERCNSNIWRKHKLARSSDECRRPRRSGSKVLLFSNQDPDRLESITTQHSRANYIAQLVASQYDAPIREFTSYFRGTVKNTSPYLITSHARRRRHAAVPIYPSLLQQTLKWNPFAAAASSSQEFVPQTGAGGRQYSCRCDECTSTRCPVNTSSTNALKQTLFKDNILTFCDQCTMTPKVNDAACGICLGVAPVMETRNANVSTTLSQSAVKECPSFSKNERRSRSRSPILKKTTIQGKPIDCGVNKKDGCEKKRNDCDEYDNGWEPGYGRKTFNLCHEAVRDTDPGECCYETGNARPYCFSKQCPRLPRYYEMEQQAAKENVRPSSPQETRIMLYNEGISDSTISRFPQCHPRRPPELITNSKVSVGRCIPEVENWIPYSHRGNSKYHDDCKRQPNQVYVGEGVEEPPIAPECPRHPTRYKKQISNSSRPVCISLPKKMLTSEKNIDAFIINGHKYYRADDDD